MLREAEGDLGWETMAVLFDRLMQAADIRKSCSKNRVLATVTDDEKLHERVVDYFDRNLVDDFSLARAEWP